MYSVLYTSEAQSFIEARDKKIKRQLKAAVERIAATPEIGKRLTHELSRFWSYRTGDYRIIYQVSHSEIVVVIIAIGNRRDVYEKMSRKP
jgi:Cytotoxic translational repressor of toxin-antitoxin stability system